MLLIAAKESDLVKYPIVLGTHVLESLCPF